MRSINDVSVSFHINELNQIGQNFDSKMRRHLRKNSYERRLYEFVDDRTFANSIIFVFDGNTTIWNTKV